MNSETWLTIKAKQFCENVTDGTHDSPKSSTFGKYLITSRHLKEFELDFLNAYKISSIEYEKIIKRSKVEKWDILYSMIGTVGNVYQERHEFPEYAIKNIGLFKMGKDENKSRWLFYFLKGNEAKEYFNSRLCGSTQRYVTLETLRNLPIKIPQNYLYRDKIIRILSSLDEKIKINNKIIKNLEEMAKAIFKNWFVDFEPFNNEEFIECEYGNIPKDWKIMKLRDVCEIQKGLSYKGQHLKNIGVPMINLGCVEPGGDFRLNKLKYYDGEFKSQHTVIPGDIVIANTDMTSERLILGSPIIIPELDCSPIIFTHHLFAFKGLKISREYLYYFLKSETFRKRAEGYANGTTVLSLSKEDILSIDFIVPDNQTLEKFANIVDKLIKLKHNSDNENLKLGKIRDSLLPKLMSGEIRVPTTEMSNEEVC